MTGMRKNGRRSSSSRLDDFDRLLSRTILLHQDPVSGLLPAYLIGNGVQADDAFKDHAWVRDNVYGVLAIWGMALAYRRRGDGEWDRLRAHELEQSATKLMRGLLLCMLNQVSRVEDFKRSLHKDSALHAKYHQRTCESVVGDYDWGHLQIDATSLFLLMLAQMTASGLNIIHNLDEVAFVQNLVFYIEEAYRIPDYGIWERGDKTNHGQTELNASSIGMAKAALEAMSGLDLFGARGGPSSVVHVLADQVAQCRTTLQSLLPRESSSKEIDAGLLSIISFPAFAVENSELINETKQQIENKLLGNYGCKRFLRDGHQTVKEDSSRLHYDPAELKIFENIECEWPLFLTYLLIDAVIHHRRSDVKKYRKLLDDVVIKDSDGITRLPQLYYVPGDNVEAEYHTPHSQIRIPGHKTQTMWGQSLYILSGLLEDGLINIGEIDPLNRRLSVAPRSEQVVQVVLLAEDSLISSELADKELITETIHSVEKNGDYKVFPARCLGDVYSQLGKSHKMGLSGPSSEHHYGALSTSSIYRTSIGQMFIFTPTFLDHDSFYLCLDNELLADLIRTELAYLKSNWHQMGCPTVTLPLMRTMLGENSSWEKSPMFRLLLELQSGYTNGVRVQLGSLSDFISTSHVVQLSFFETSSKVDKSLDRPLLRQSTTSLLDRSKTLSHMRLTPIVSPVAGSVKRSRKTPTNEFARPAPSPLAVAAAWSQRRRSYGGSRHLKTGTETLHSYPSENALNRQHILSLSAQELVDMLKNSSNSQEQADLLHCMHSQFGENFDTKIDGHEGTTVKVLLQELYEKVGICREWSLVRHIAGMLTKKLDDLSQVSTDLLVRQKHFSVGQPQREIHITKPLPSNELMDRICSACGGDHSAVALTQEILVYLAMFIKAEPQLFNEMLRLRIGLIQNVMVTELASITGLSSEDATERLLSYTPFQLKIMLHHIFSRKEFILENFHTQDSSQISTKQLSIITPTKGFLTGQLQQNVKALGEADGIPEDLDRQDQWRRRRRLDGALNRVPPDFYTEVWQILEKCEGISIGSTYLPRNPTVREMTPGELKFALRVESVLNSLPDPEYRQLVVEVLMVCGLLCALNPEQQLNQSIVVENIIRHAHQLFLEDQRACEGAASYCCTRTEKAMCGGYMEVCVHFYNSSPSGVYGTMSYFARAMVERLGEIFPGEHSCRIS